MPTTHTLSPAAAAVHVPAAFERWLADNPAPTDGREYVGRHRGQFANETEMDAAAYPQAKVISPA